MNLKLKLKVLLIKSNGTIQVCNGCKDIVRDVIYALIQLIPIGKVTTYKDVASAIGTNARVVGRVLSSNDKPIVIPCHRVVRSDGDIGGYTLRGKKCKGFKAKLLKLEGIELRGNKVPKRYIVSLSSFLVKYAN